MQHAAEHDAQPALAGDPGPQLDTDTIAAIVTGAQQGSVAIIRLSGPEAVQIASAVFKPSNRRSPWVPKSHRIHHGQVVDTDSTIVDEVLLLTMLAPRSYTSEDVIELQCHGGGVCVQRVLACCLTAGARLAKPGEFTLRAFLNGRLDLSQAESVNELVGARTAAAADSAIAGLTGGIGAMVQKLRHSALLLLAELEAMIDFEEDVPDSDMQRLQQRVQEVGEGVQQALGTASRGRLLTAGLQVALVGRPNVGKSSLLNAWSGTDKAIVTQVAGTTRDIVQADVVVGGIPVSLLDTAGMREASDVVERLGVERSQAAALQADVAILVLDAQAGWTSDDQTIFDHLWGRAVAGSSPAITAPSILVWNKVDLTTPHTPPLAPPPLPQQQLIAGSGAKAATPSACNTTNTSTLESNVLHQQAVSRESTVHAAEAASAVAGPPSSFPSSSPSAPGGSHPPLQPGTSRLSQAHSHRQTAPSSDSIEPRNVLGSAQDFSARDAISSTAQTGTEATSSAAASAVSSSADVGRDSHNTTPTAPTSSNNIRNHDQQAGLCDDNRAQLEAMGLPSSCVGCFAACLETCATSGLGLDALNAALLDLVDAPSLASGGVGWAVNSRQAEALIRAQAALADVSQSIADDLPIDFWTIDLRAAVVALGEVSGDGVTEEVLDSVFSQFCIGK